MGKIFRTDYRIPFYESDVNQNVKLSHLANVCLQVSGLQGEELGMSDQKVLDDYGLVWVVTDYEININRLPRFAEKISIETEAISYNKLFCYREFRLFDDQGQILVTILVSFVLMDVETRKVNPVIEDIVAVFGGDKTKKLVRGPKYASLQVAGQDKKVTYLDLDMNGHVNNSKYIDWLFEGLDLDFLRQHALRKINIKYNKEIHYGTTVQLALEQDQLVSRHQIASQLGVHAQAEMIWEVIDD